MEPLRDRWGGEISPVLTREVVEYLNQAYAVLTSADVIDHVEEPGQRLNGIVASVAALRNELAARIKGAFCPPCRHATHEPDCPDSAPNPQFRCHCSGPCLHGNHPHYCRECKDPRG